MVFSLSQYNHSVRRLLEHKATYAQTRPALKEGELVNVKLMLFRRAGSGDGYTRLVEMGSMPKAIREAKKKRRTELKAERKALAAKHVGEEEEEAAPSPELVALDTKIDELTETRKELAGSNFRDKHYQVGSVILGLGTAFAIEGPVNTFLRAQKLFPGPHLYAGAGVVVAWALAASTVPLMSKGKDWARSAHIAFNLLAFGLFTWQLPTGWEITQKVIKFTQWP